MSGEVIKLPSREELLAMALPYEVKVWGETYDGKCIAIIWRLATAKHADEVRASARRAERLR